MSEELTRKVEFQKAWDKRSEGYGQHGVNIEFYLSGPKGVIQFIVYTGWSLDLVNQIIKKPRFGPSGADLGYHSYVPVYEGQEPMSVECPKLGGKRCFYGGSGLQADEMLNVLISQGDDEVWRRMEEQYHDIFDNITLGEQAEADAVQTVSSEQTK